MSERLHKRIAAAGVCSRRAAEELIRQGRVMVNGSVVTEMGVQVGDDDTISVDGQVVAAARLMTLMMNKPKGYTTTLSDPFARQTVGDLLPKLSAQLKPIGRLDKDTEGLLLFTNDGQLALRLTHPRYGVEKEYVALVDGEPDDKALEKLRKGVFVEGKKTAPAKVERSRNNPSELMITIHEGRKRQIRLMCLSVGFPVSKLKRVRVGPIRMRNLPKGTCKMLSQIELAALRAAVGLE